MDRGDWMSNFSTISLSIGYGYAIIDDDMPAVIGLPM